MGHLYKNQISREIILFSTIFCSFVFLPQIIFASATAPRGGLDTVQSCDAVIGWAQDQDIPSQPISVAFYVDAPSGAAAFVENKVANENQNRSDLCAIGACNNSFTYSIPAKYRDGATHTLYAYGLDNDGGTTQNTLLTGSPKTFQCAPPAAKNTPPRGGLDVVQSCDAVLGWAQDLDAPNQGITVGFYIDAPSGVAAYAGNVMAYQNQNRPDLCAIGACNSSFTYSVPSTYRDGKTHVLYAYGIDSAGGENPLLVGSPKSFQCAPAASRLPVQSNDASLKVEAVGNIETVFKYATDACSPTDSPDTFAHAFRDASGLVNFIDSSGSTNYRSVGSSLNSVKRTCSSIYTAANDTAFNNFKYHEWPFSPYTLDGSTVYMLAHNEWYPSLMSPPACPVNTAAAPVVGAITLLTSSNSGANYIHPANYKVGVPTVPWSPSFSCTASYGDWNFTNIVQKSGFYYALFNRVADPNGVANMGTCAMRTARLDDASSWQVWSGSDWLPMSSSPKCGVLEGLGSWTWTVAGSLSYSTYLGKYIAIGTDNTTNVTYALSDDLLHWSTPQLILGLPVPGMTLYYASLLDPTDTSRNFENVGQEPYLYFTVLLSRDIIRQKIRFTKLDAATAQPVVTPPPPTALSVPANPSVQTTTTGVTTNAMPAPLCPSITRTLSLRSRGADVATLQSYLISQNLLSPDSATGYFGRLTQTAVQSWQCQRGLICTGSPRTTGYGAVGPRTRAALLSCAAR